LNTLETQVAPPSVGGAIPSPPLHVSTLDPRVAKPFIEKWHYSHKAPTGKNVFFGWWIEGELYAVTNYGIGVNQVQEKFLAKLTGLPIVKESAKEGKRGNLYELKRLCRVEPKRHNYPLTQFLPRCHRILKKEHGIRFIVSFSDPEHNRLVTTFDETHHDSGGIYKAANFRYLGKTNAEFHVVDKQGIRRHRRFAYRYMNRVNATRGQEAKLTLAEARKLLGLRRVATVPKDRWFLDLGDKRVRMQNPTGRVSISEQPVAASP